MPSAPFAWSSAEARVWRTVSLVANFREGGRPGGALAQASPASWRTAARVCVRRESEPELLEVVEKGFHFVEQACLLGFEQDTECALQREVMCASDVTCKAVVEYDDSTRRFETEHQDLSFPGPQVRQERESLL